MGNWHSSTLGIPSHHAHPGWRWWDGTGLCLCGCVKNRLAPSPATPPSLSPPSCWETGGNIPFPFLYPYTYYLPTIHQSHLPIPPLSPLPFSPLPFPSSSSLLPSPFPLPKHSKLTLYNGEIGLDDMTFTKAGKEEGRCGRWEDAFSATCLPVFLCGSEKDFGGTGTWRDGDGGR